MQWLIHHFLIPLQLEIKNPFGGGPFRPKNASDPFGSDWTSDPPSRVKDLNELSAEDQNKLKQYLDDLDPIAKDAKEKEDKAKSSGSGFDLDVGALLKIVVAGIHSSISFGNSWHVDLAFPLRDILLG